MLIETETIQKAKEAIGDRNADLIAEIMEIEDYNPSRRVGHCPNPDHNDSTPSCSYNPKTHCFHCFGCGYTVDLIDAIMLKQNKTFNEACQTVFEEASIPYDFTECGLKSKSSYRYPNPKYADNKETVYKYWESRMISRETIDYLGIEQDTHGNTLFQYRDLNDVLVTCKVRKSYKVDKKTDGPKCWYLPDCDSTHILFNINRINTSQPLIITTGEGDCAAAIECGFYNTTSIDGGDQNTMWISECWDWLQQFDTIILVHDNDESGRKYIKEVSSRLGEYRVKVVEIPLAHENEDGTRRKIKDLNELLFLEGKDKVREVINNARDREIPSVVDYTDIAMFDMSDVDGIKTGIPELDNAIDKFYVGTTTVLTGIAGSGKSTFLSTVACKSMEQGFPVFIYSGELPNVALKNWIDCVNAGQRNLNQYINPDGKAYYKLKYDAYKKINEFYKGKMFIYKDGFEQQTSRILDTMEGVVRKYGVRTLIIDNMTSVDLENDDTNKYIKQDAFVRDLIEFAKKWQVIVLVVLHPKKMDMIRRMSLFDLQGCVSAVNLAHRVISLYRVQPKDRQGVRGRNGDFTIPPIKYDVFLDILKDRYGSAAGKNVGLYYDYPSKRFFTNRENLDYQYAWDTNDYGDDPLPYGCPQLDEEDEPFGPQIKGGPRY